MTQYGTWQQQPAPQGQPVWPPAQPPKKKRSGALWIVLGAVLGVLLLCGIGGVIVAAGDGQPTAGNAPVEYADPTTAPAEEPAAEPTTAAAKAPEKKAAPAKKTWKTVATLNGSENKNGPVFRLSGAPARLSYTFKKGNLSLVAIYVLSKGTVFERDGGIPEVMPQSRKGSTELYKEPGEYYLKVIAANTTWSVTVQELR
jgi:hypothetical protein